jgi:hypothetical protein
MCGGWASCFATISSAFLPARVGRASADGEPGGLWQMAAQLSEIHVYVQFR